MKKVNLFFWITTILFAGFMAMSGFPNLIKNQESIDFISKGLGYPEYFIPFIGLAKILGSLVLVIPGLNRIKEWAYSGLFFDLIAAGYSFWATGNKLGSPLFLLLPLAVGGVSYYLHHQRLKAKAA